MPDVLRHSCLTIPMRKLLLFAFLSFIIHANAFSQLHYIAGTVQDEAGKPLSGVEVFLAGTTRIAVSDEEGNFNISRLATGNYELAAKLLGRETYTATFTLTKSSRFNITLTLKNRQLDEVVIRPNSYSNADYNLFARTLLGTTPNAAKCKILNPKILNIFRDPETRILHVNSGGEFLLIDNEALGYNVKYLLDEFVLDSDQSLSMYVGQAVFTEMQGSESKKATWRKARAKAYLGSPQHLLRSVYHDNLIDQKFIVRKLSVTPDEQSITEKEYVRKQEHFANLLAAKTITRSQHSDSSNMILRRVRMPESKLSVGKDTLEGNSLISGRYDTNKQLDLSAPLHILYLGEKPAIGYHHDRFIEGTEKDDYRHQMSTISSRKGFVPYIDAYGNILSPLSVIFNGYMGWERMAEMLPREFLPDEPQVAAIKKEL